MRFGVSVCAWADMAHAEARIAARNRARRRITVKRSRLAFLRRLALAYWAIGSFALSVFDVLLLPITVGFLF